MLMEPLSWKYEILADHCIRYRGWKMWRERGIKEILKEILKRKEQRRLQQPPSCTRRITLNDSGYGEESFLSLAAPRGIEPRPSD